MSIHIHKPITVEVDNGTTVREKAEEKESVLFPVPEYAFLFSKKKGCSSFKNVLKKNVLKTQDYEYLHKICICSVLKERSHVETLLTGYKSRGRKGRQCVSWYGLI